MTDTTTIRPRMTPDRVRRAATAVASAFEADVRLILDAPRSGRQVSAARQALYRLLYDTTSATYAEIARLFQRDHTTILYGVQKTHDWRDQAPAYAAALEQARRMVLA